MSRRLLVGFSWRKVVQDGTSWSLVLMPWLLALFVRWFTHHLSPKQSVPLVMADFGQTDFGQTEFDLCLCVCAVWWVCVFAVWRGSCSVPPVTALPWTALSLDRPSLDRLPLDRPSLLDCPKFRSFFFLSRRKIRSFLPPLWVSPR